MAVGDTYVFPGFLTPVQTQLFFPKPPTTFLCVSAEVRGENTPERKAASTWSQTHNHQVMSPTRSPLSHPGRAHTTQRFFQPEEDFYPIKERNHDFSNINFDMFLANVFSFDW